MAAVMEPMGDGAAFVADRFAAMHARFRRPLERFFASYRLNSADVDDLTQEVFLRLAGESCPADLQRPDAFVFTLARNLVRDRARRLYTKAVRQSVSLDDIELRCNGPTPDEAFEHDERLERVARALDSLKEATRHAFIQHRVHGCTHAEIARRMGVSVSMVEKHVMSAIAALRRAAD